MKETGVGKTREDEGDVPPTMVADVVGGDQTRDETLLSDEDKGSPDSANSNSPPSYAKEATDQDNPHARSDISSNLSGGHESKQVADVHPGTGRHGVANSGSLSSDDTTIHPTSKESDENTTSSRQTADCAAEVTDVTVSYTHL